MLSTSVLKYSLLGHSSVSLSERSLLNLTVKWISKWLLSAAGVLVVMVHLYGVAQKRTSGTCMHYVLCIYVLLFSAPSCSNNGWSDDKFFFSYKSVSCDAIDRHISNFNKLFISKCKNVSLDYKSQVLIHTATLHKLVLCCIQSFWWRLWMRDCDISNTNVSCVQQKVHCSSQTTSQLARRLWDWSICFVAWSKWLVQHLCLAL